jgi:hypothetical protein
MMLALSSGCGGSTPRDVEALARQTANVQACLREEGYTARKAGELVGLITIRHVYRDSAGHVISGVIYVMFFPTADQARSEEEDLRREGVQYARVGNVIYSQPVDDPFSKAISRCIRTA